MPKAPGKHRKSSNTNDAAARLLRQWQAAVAPLDDFAVKSIEDIQHALASVLAEAIAQSGEPLANCGLRIHRAYRQVMAAYRAITAIGDACAAPLTCTRTRGIWDGIRAVAASRVKIDRGGADAESIMLAERAAAVSIRAEKAAEALQAALHRFRVAHQRDCLLHVREAFTNTCDTGTGMAAFAYIQDSLHTHTFEIHYDIYYNALACLRAALSAYDKRLSISHCCDWELLSEEHGILASLAQIQAAALADCIQKGDTPEAEHAMLTRVCDTLTEAHRHLTAEWSELHAALSGGADLDRPEALPKEAYAEAIAAFITGHARPTAEALEALCAAHTQAAAPFLDALAADIGTLTERALNGFDAASAAFEYQQMLYKQDCMTTGITDIFRDILCAYNRDAALLAAAECADITKGVAETLAIKIESLAESQAAFAEEMEALFAQFAETPAPAPPEAQAITADGIRLVIETLRPLPCEGKRGADALRQALQNCERHELLLAYRDGLIRNWNRQTDTVCKKLTAYKKEQLLFECSTFEEILYYSVSRLRESPDAAVAAFVAAIHAGTSQLECVLTRHGIEFIRPAPHDAFNGREHEVLMAEQHDGFRKGEVVKLMNRGYKQDGTVLMRANVIAAK